MENPIGWFEIYVEDMSRAKTFYEAVFERQLEQLDGGDGLQMWAFESDMAAYGSGGALVHMPGVPAGGNSTIVYFNCQDCANQEQRTKEHGGSVFKSKFSIGEYGYVSLVHDTEGNVIGLHSQQ